MKSAEISEVHREWQHWIRCNAGLDQVLSERQKMVQPSQEKAVARCALTGKITFTMPRTHLRLSRVFGFAALALSVASGLVSCKTTESGSDYASNYSTDGGFNPYPGQGAVAQPGSTSRSHHQYAEAPPPPGFELPSSAPKYTPPPVHGSSSSSVKKTTSSYTPSSSSGVAKKTTSTAAKKPAAKKKSTGSSYTVVKGDTLSAIARKKGTTVAKIKAANGMSNDFLSIGKKLMIP